jgi:hypothetical protein
MLAISPSSVFDSASALLRMRAAASALRGGQEAISAAVRAGFFSRQKFTHSMNRARSFGGFDCPRRVTVFALLRIAKAPRPMVKKPL